MDSKERDQRAKYGFGERGEKLYRGKRRKFKKNYDYDMFEKTTEGMLKQLKKNN
jgi:hypothetical protein